MNEKTTQEFYTDLIKKIKKPSAPHIMESQIEQTEEELQRNAFAEAQLAALGISTTVFSTCVDEYEDPDILEAMMIAYRGEIIPEDLRQRILAKKQKDLDDENA